MAEFRKYVLALALVALFVGLSSPASAQVTNVPFQCSATTVVNNLRAEGMTEMTGDIVIDCKGGTALPTGQKLPSVNITVTTSAPLTSKITASIPAVVGPNTNFSEALLIVDDPNTVSWAGTTAAMGGGARNVLNCGNPGAPDTDPAEGAGICAILAPGNQVLSYDGTALSQPAGGAACTAGVTTPIAGTGAGFGCGRPNVFQARQDLDPLGGLLQQRIVFLNVPVDQPGTVAVPSGAIPGQTIPANCDLGGICHHIFRITNVRVNAATVGTGSGLVSGTQVFADLTVSDSHIFPLVNAGITSAGIGSLLIGRVNTTLLEPPGIDGPLNLVGCQDTDVNVGTIIYEEIVADAWKPRNISLTLTNQQGGAAGALFALNTAIVGGAAAAFDANDCFQNVPGVNFATEAGFQNALGVTGVASAVCPGGTPPVNPPNGLGAIATPVPPGFTVFADGTPGCTRTGICRAGVATSGTRLVFRVRNIFGNNVVNVSAPAQVFLKNRTNGNVTGIAILQNYGAACNPTAAAENVFCPAPGNVNTLVPLGNLSTGLCTRPDGTTIPGSTCTSAFGFYEIVYTDPGVLETMSVRFHVNFEAAAISTATPVTPSPVTLGTGLGYGPDYANNAPQKFATLSALPSSGAAFPYPRFVPTPGPDVRLFAINGKCVCNLLFPYATDGFIEPGAAFETGIAIANTSRDPGTQARAGGNNGGLGPGFNNAFGFTTPATAECEDDTVPHCHVVVNEQQGPVQFWYFNTAKDTTNNAVNFGNLGNGPQGNTQCTNTATPGQCNDLDGQLTLNTGTNVPAGGVLTTLLKAGSSKWGLLGIDPFVTSSDGTFTGYIIAQASFQYCHGTAFITTNGFGIAPGLNVPALSYQALVLDNPGLNFRTDVEGEAIDH